MSFDIARTPTLEAVATLDEQALARDLQTRVEESIRAAESQPEVVEAVATQREGAEELARLRKSERALSEFGRELRERTAAAADEAIDGLIAAAASGEKADLKKLQVLSSMERHGQFTTRAIQRLIEKQIPEAQIASLRTESRALEVTAQAVEKVAQERAEKLLGQLRDAVTEEMVLPVDMSRGVLGVLLNHANGLKRMAKQIAENAERLEKSYGERRSQ